MSRLLENILKKRNNQVLQEFDMSKSSNAMMRHLGTFPYPEADLLPIDPEIASWKQLQIDNKISLQKKYDLGSSKFLIYFLNEIVNLSEEYFHHPDILIQHNKVTVTLYTRDINDVTERDLEMSKKIDEIIEDINVIKFRG